MAWQGLISADLIDRYEFYNYGHAVEILTGSFPQEWKEIEHCLRNIKLTIDDIKQAGGRR